MILLAVVSLSGCKGAKEIPVNVVEIVKHDTVTLQQIKVDSVTKIDSVYEYLYIKGDTVVHEKTKYVDRVSYKMLHDSIYIVKMDSVEVPVKIIAEKKLTTWQSIKVKYGGWAIGLVLVLLIAAILYYKKL